MKAKIIPEPKCVLLWNCDPSQPGYDKLRQLCRQAGLEVKHVSGGDAGKTVGLLCGFRGAPQTSALLLLDDAAYPPAIIFCGVPQNQLSALVDRVNATGLKFPLKAMVTIHNRDWMLAHLLDELTRERTALEGTAQ